MPKLCFVNDRKYCKYADVYMPLNQFVDLKLHMCPYKDKTVYVAPEALLWHNCWYNRKPIAYTLFYKNTNK